MTANNKIAVRAKLFFIYVSYHKKCHRCCKKNATVIVTVNRMDSRNFTKIFNLRASAHYYFIFGKSWYLRQLTTGDYMTPTNIILTAFLAFLIVSNIVLT